MPYRFATERADYSDYASGTVFYSAPGHAAFPIRLTSEIFQRCRAVRASAGAGERAVLYDPCCGAAYHLSTLAFMHWEGIAAIIGSDVDPEILPVAERNLGLLTREGLDRRIDEIAGMLAAYGKASHATALESARRLRRRLEAHLAHHEIGARVFRADATEGAAVRAGVGGPGAGKVDMVISDIPYGQHAFWRSADPRDPAPADPVRRMLGALRPILADGAVVAIASDKGQTIAHAAYRRADRFRIGKRQIVVLVPDD